MKRKPILRQDLSIGLKIDELEFLLAEVIAPSAINKELSASCRKYRGISRSYREKGNRLDDNEIEEVITILSLFLTSLPYLPSIIVARIHTCIGILRGEQKLYSCATSSFLKVLWIYKSKPDTYSINLALTLHRLALIYSKSGDDENAIPLLEKALHLYNEKGNDMKQNQEIITDARDLLNQLQKQCQTRVVQVLHGAFMAHRCIKVMPTIPED